ncbi:MAG TPA: hypothetical protein PLW65_05745 [Pseudomonadota bacterium]|nr:hypothetical protein [Pseudomonadota bacterium]
MSKRGPESAAQRRRRIFAEAQDLVEDRALRCELCQRRMRYWPVGEKTVQRAAGRYFSWRCDGCFFAGEIVAAALAGHALSPVQLREGRLQQAAAVTEHLEELQAEPPSELVAAALERLGLQLQALAEQIEAATTAIARGRGIVLYSDAQLGHAPRHIPWTPHPPAPAQA